MYKSSITLWDPLHVDNVGKNLVFLLIYITIQNASMSNHALVNVNISVWAEYEFVIFVWHNTFVKKTFWAEKDPVKHFNEE